MRRLLLLCTGGGGVVDGLFDSKDIEPRVRLGVRFGPSESFDASFLSKSLGLSVDDAGCFVWVSDLSASEIIK